jgi:ABC-type Fe3+-hydroxamate transport system substrate-binding protein
MKKIFVDQLGNSIAIDFPPKRIISLVPSQTELLFDLGLDVEIVGTTKFCIHPKEKALAKTKIGGTKKLDLDKIRSLKPDLIIGNKEENEKTDIVALQQEFPVWMSDIVDLEDAKDMIQRIGELTDRSPEATYLVHLIHAGFRDLQQLALEKRISQKVLYMIWKKPFMAAGRDTFIDDVLRSIGLENVVEASRYPMLATDDISGLMPELVLLSSEPYPFNEKNVEEFRLLLPESNVLIVDGEMFSWYGSRLVKAIGYLFELQKQLATAGASEASKKD